MADALSELALRFGSRRDQTPEEAEARLRLLMEDVSDALDGDACRAAIRAGIKTWSFLPTCAEVVAAAKPFVEQQRFQARMAREAAECVALPAPEYLDADKGAALFKQLRVDLRAGDLTPRNAGETYTPAERLPLLPSTATNDASDSLKELARRMGAIA